MTQPLRARKNNSLGFRFRKFLRDTDILTLFVFVETVVLMDLFIYWIVKGV